MLTKIERPHRWDLKGTREGWHAFAKLAGTGNPLVIFSFCTALVPPLLALLREDSFGVYLVGSTSTGKSALSSCAGSVWGGDPRSVLGFGLGWRATVNALEVRALSACDGLLILDDTQLIRGNKTQRAETLRDALFGLAGGTETARLNAPQEPRNWHTVIWSTGNDSVAKILADGRIDYDESSAVRMLEVPANRAHGVFDHIPQRFTAARFAEGIKRAANVNFGWASDSFLSRLILLLTRDPATLVGNLQTVGNEMRRSLDVDERDGVLARDATKAGVIFAAGVLGSQSGALPFSRAEVQEAIIDVMQSHWAFTREATREADHVARVRDIIAEHRAQFVDLGDPNLVMSEALLQRAPGFIVRSKARSEYCFLPDKFEQLFRDRSGAIEPAITALKQQGLLVHDQGNAAASQKNQTKRRLPLPPPHDRVRVYCIDGRILDR